MTDQPYVVVLTGGALPSQPTPQPRQLDVDVAVESALKLCADNEGRAGNDLPSTIASEAYMAGWHAAARDLRVAAVYILGDKAEAEEFAAYMTGRIDPAFVRQTSDPAAEKWGRG